MFDNDEGPFIQAHEHKGPEHIRRAFSVFRLASHVSHAYCTTNTGIEMPCRTFETEVPKKMSFKPL
jgi:hypothetical protein